MLANYHIDLLWRAINVLHTELFTSPVESYTELGQRCGKGRPNMVFSKEIKQMKHDKGGENCPTEVIKGLGALHTSQNKSSVTSK